jgi:hypothetical protein
MFSLKLCRHGRRRYAERPRNDATFARPSACRRALGGDRGKAGVHSLWKLARLRFNAAHSASLTLTPVG